MSSPITAMVVKRGAHKLLLCLFLLFYAPIHHPELLNLKLKPFVMSQQSGIRTQRANQDNKTGRKGTSGFTVTDEMDLKTQLLNVSGISNVRPDRVTLVELKFSLLSINKVDLKYEQFSVSGWWSLIWTDSRLSWRNTNYTSIHVTQVYSSQIWTPALVVDNSVENLSAIDEKSIPIRLRQSGLVTWNPPGILVTSCEMVVTYFPFDTQSCTIQVTSFGYTIQELNISVQSIGISQTYFQKNGEWTLLSTWNDRSEYTEGDYTYAKVTFHFMLQRRPVYYGLNTMLPVLLNSLLIPLVFLLPHDAGEKTGYCLTVLLAYVVILTIVTDGLPTTAKNQSLLGVFIAVVLVMSALSVALVIHSLNIYHRSPERPIPHWQAKLSRQGLRIMRLQCASERSRSITPVKNLTEESNDRQGDVRHRVLGCYGKKQREEDHNVSSSNVQADVTSIVSEGSEEMTWHLVARAYDAFLLRLYFLIVVIASLVIFLLIASNQF